MKSLSEDVSVVAFYGIRHSASGIEAYYRLSLRWFESLGLEPDRMGVSGEGQSANVSSFARTSKKLAREGFEKITGFEMYATEPDARVFWRDCICSADYEGLMNGTHLFVTVRDSIATLDSRIMSQIVGEIATELKPVYGIGFVRKKQLGPGFYAIGILKGPAGDIPTEEEYEKELRVCRWGDVGMPEQVYRQGLLRDVFPQNFLTRTHLQKRIGGMQLREWIAQDIGRGTLASVSDEMSLWSVATDQIEPIQRSFRRAGLIFEWTEWSPTRWQ